MSLKEEREHIFQLLGYEPTVAQQPIHDSAARIKLVAGGERGGKSMVSAKEYMGRHWETPLLWLVAQDYERTRPEFNYICDDFAKLGYNFTATSRVDPGEITVAGSGFRIATKSAKDPRRIAAEAPDGILACEGSQLDYETFLRLRGRLAEKRGWMVLSGTFESSLGWYPQLYTQWQLPNEDGGQSFSLPTWSNLVIFPGGREDPEILALEKGSSKEWFAERFGGQPCPPMGRVFDEFAVPMHTGIGGDYEFKKDSEVHLFIDPGYSSAYSVLACQKRGEHLWVVDEIYERGFVTSDIIKICKQRPWWDKVIGGAIDIAAKAHQAMPAPAEIWLKEAGVYLQSKKLLIRDGIEVVKRFLLIDPLTNQPRLHVNARCKGLISELGGCESPITGQTEVYQWKKDREGSIVGEVPEDRHNHACKALAYGLVALFGFSPIKKRPRVRFF